MNLTDKGSNNIIVDTGVLYQGCNVIFEGSNNFLIVEPDAQLINLKIWVRGSDNRISIGKGAIVKGVIELLRNGSEVSIGSGTTIGETAHFITDDGSKIAIGSDCMFADRVILRGTDGHPLWDLDTGERLNSSEDIVVEDYVWIAQDVSVLKGVNVGRGSVIGKNAVVTKDIPHTVSAAGVPAKVVSTNVTWSRTVNPKSLFKDKVAMKYVGHLLKGSVDQ